VLDKWERGEWPGYKFGRAVRFDLEEILALGRREGDTVKSPAVTRRVSRNGTVELLAPIERLRAELWSQWESNHAEHCGKPLPHDGDCYWPPPDVLSEEGGSQ
jgi:hypothetical protein